MACWPVRCQHGFSIAFREAAALRLSQVGVAERGADAVPELSHQVTVHLRGARGSSVSRVGHRPERHASQGIRGSATGAGTTRPWPARRRPLPASVPSCLPAAVCAPVSGPVNLEAQTRRPPDRDSRRQPLRPHRSGELGLAPGVLSALEGRGRDSWHWRGQRNCPLQKSSAVRNGSPAAGRPGRGNCGCSVPARRRRAHR
jgi:hypothetical protein